MEEKIKVAFDLDGVIIDKPPLIPKGLLEWLFRGGSGRKDELYYRYPKCKIERWIRKLSHFYLFRPPIKQNVVLLKKLAVDKRYELYVVSARYSFLENETKKWLEKRGMDGVFKRVFINLPDEQPHLFKEEILIKLKPDIFIDDDCLLADYLVEKKVSKKIYCFSLKGISNCKKAKSISFEELKSIL